MATIAPPMGTTRDEIVNAMDEVAQARAALAAAQEHLRLLTSKTQRQEPATLSTHAIAEARYARKMLKNGEARRLRKEAGFSCSEIARVVGVSHQTVNFWETSNQQPKTEAAVRLAAVLHELERPVLAEPT